MPARSVGRAAVTSQADLQSDATELRDTCCLQDDSLTEGAVVTIECARGLCRWTAVNL
jgi:hypothetical protein